MSEKEPWTYHLDWLNIISILGLDSIKQIPESKKEKALKNLSKQYGNDLLSSFSPQELDELVASELKELMKKDLIILEKRQEKLEKEIQNKAAPFKNGIIGIDLSEMSDIDPEDLIKFFNKAMRGGNDDDDKDDDTDNYDDDRNGYYI
jgi:hypothetical protein